MQLAEIMVKLKHPKPEEIKTDWFKIPFTFSRPGQNTYSPEDDPYNGYTQEEYEQHLRNLTNDAKARWGMRKRMGYQPPQPNGKQ